METQRAFAAIAISLIILLGYQYFFMPTPQIPEQPAQVEQTAGQIQGDHESPTISQTAQSAPSVIGQPVPQTQLNGRDINITTSLYQATITENGGALKSFKLHNYREKIDKDSPAKELITATAAENLPLLFNWGNGQTINISKFTADRDSLSLAAGSSKSITMKGSQPGVEILRTMTFSDQNYLIKMAITVRNISSQPLQGSPNLGLINRPFTKDASNQFLFSGPAVYLNGELKEISVSDLEKAPMTLNGNVSWLAYENTYFMCSILPDKPEQLNVQLSMRGEDTVVANLSGADSIIAPGAEQTYIYSVYVGPKELETLKKSGNDLAKIVNFGWFDIIAKPALYMLNFFNKYFHNYGIAIILVTVIFKLVFWPISHKGMKSMKTMQKIQPKMVKLREKYKNDKERLNQEMIALYKTYKVNPLGGCLPMVLQIPVFFALYKVLLQTIELRHAPFMLWITDLSAPDRLFIGFDIPFLGGIPVLTLLMGASMFLQQKMTPSAADPTQAKIMMFLPVIFTFMFLNFASGLVLYWFINNLLSIGQQYFINRSVE